MSGHQRRRSRSDVRVCLQQNVWLLAAVALVVIYCVFMVYATVWAQTFNTRVASVSEAGEDTAKHLDRKKIQNAQRAVPTGPRFSAEGEDTIAYNDEVPLDDAGVIPLVGVTEEADIKTVTRDASAHQTLDHQTTAIDASSTATTDLVTAVPRATDATESEGPAMPSVVATEMPVDNEPLGTGGVRLPVADGEVVQHRAPVSDAMTTSVKSTVPQNFLQPAPVRPSDLRRRFNMTRLMLKTPEQSNTWAPLETRHHTVIGYNATLAYLHYCTKPVDSKEELFLFFTCSTSEGGQDDWNPNCATAREKVYALFAKSPSTNRLVTIYAGPHDDWRGGNDFTHDDDLRLKALPTLMRWDGGAPGARRSTWGVLVDMSILYAPLVRYLFRNVDELDQLLATPQVETKEIVTLRGYKPYRAFVEAYATTGSSYPLFIMMLSGRWEHNNRLWCPWCRQSELPVEYAFYAYAPVDAKLVLVETYDNGSEWRQSDNEFKLDPQLAIKGVPWFYRVYPGPLSKPLTYERVTKKFYILEALQQVFGA